MNTPAPLITKSITVKPDRIVCEVLIPDPAYRYATQDLIDRIRRDVPHLPDHTCKNAEGRTFAAVMDHTSTPHVLEHMIIELQAKAAPDPAKVFVGTTEWLDEHQGLARIEVSFTDDLDALRAFRAAVQILNEAML